MPAARVAPNKPRAMSAEAKAEAKAVKAASVAKAAKEGAEAKVKEVTVKGYADRSGSTAYNESIAYDRAYTVIQELQNQGLSAGNFVPQSLGEDANEVPTDDGKREARNRRVVIMFTR